MANLPTPIISISTLIIINTAIIVGGVSLYIYGSAVNSISNSTSNSTSNSISNSANTSTNNIESIRVAEIEAFNSQFEVFEGKQAGTYVNTLIGRLIAVANTYKNEPEKVPSLSIDKMSSTNEEGIFTEYNISGEENLQEYVNNLAIIKSELENKHYYKVNFSYGTMGLINRITIEY